MQVRYQLRHSPQFLGIGRILLPKAPILIEEISMANANKYLS